jgi:hypothetical protein
LAAVRAIGLVRRTVSADPRVNETTIRTLANTRGYDLRGILTIHAESYMPTVLTIQTVHEHGAVAMIVSALKHLGGTENVIRIVCDVVTPRETYPHFAENHARGNP